MTKNNTALVILNKNDSACLKLQLKEIDFSLFSHVFAIDGDSIDDSLKILKKFKIETYDGIPGGRGGAIKFAINNLKGNFSSIIFLSSDGEENPKDLRLIKSKLDQGYDLVIASRMINKSSFKSSHNFFYIHRKIFLWFITSLINILFKGNIRDCWNGYRGINLKSARKLNLDQNDFLLEAQMTIQFLKHNFKIIEIPTVERKRFDGKSQNPAIASGWRHIILLINEYFKKINYEK